MASEDSSNKFSSNLKVPPLKIVLSSHQNNTVMNVSKVSDDKYDKNGSNREEDESEDTNQTEHKKESSSKRSKEELAGRNNAEGGGDRTQSSKRKGYRSNTESNNHSSAARNLTDEFLSSSSNSSSVGSSTTSDQQPASTSPSSESESFASNSTIIAEQQPTYQRRAGSRPDHKDNRPTTPSTSVSKQERISRNNSSKSTANDRSDGHQTGVTTNSGKRSHESNTSESEPAIGQSNQHANSNNNNSSSSTRETSSSSNANQRITRSSQRAALQNKTENQSDSVADDAEQTRENQEKASESARKVKRRKGEPQESETDANQSANQPPVMANICPADYQLPAQNSFELYRDIRERPYKKMLELNNIQPKVPQGFRDYLLSSGPYLLDGNKLGVGLNGAKYDNLLKSGRVPSNGLHASSSSHTKLTTSFQRKYLAHQPSQHHRHSGYNIPKLCDTPKSLVEGTPLHELFVEQEKARHQMRMQHLKERERSILAAEQEILRAYNNAAIANAGQKLHLSACTYFYYQERYHYVDDKTSTNGKSNVNEVPHSQDNSFLCIEGKETTKPVNGTATSEQDQTTVVNKDSQDSGTSSNTDKSSNPSDANSNKVTGQVGSSDSSEAKVKQEASDAKVSNSADVKSTKTDLVSKLESKDATKEGDGKIDFEKHATGEKVSNVETSKSDEDTNSNTKDKLVNELESNKTEQADVEDTKDLNRKVFVQQLQDVDDKWAKIKQEMLVRHKNEADSLYAVQSLEWEWKVKETGACDVRVPMRVEPEFVPRVVVSSLDY